MKKAIAFVAALATSLSLAACGGTPTLSVTTDETGCSKQDFAIYERAIAELGSTRETTWAVDDAPYAIGVMGDFGLNTIAVGNGCSPERAQLLRNTATRFVDTLEELL